MSCPLVSVIVPNYCHSAFLEQRFKTIFNQTYQNMEVIILDDASPDNGASQKIIEQYRSHPKVSNIVYNIVNCGSTFIQWQKGLSLAKGQWVWIAESDDYCELNYLQTCLDFVSHQDSISFVYCRSCLVNSAGHLLGYAPSAPGGLYNGQTFIKDFMTAGSSVWNASAVLFKKSEAAKYINSIIDFKAAGDYFFWCLLAETGDVGVIDDTLNYFRQHDEKVTPKRSIDGTEDHEVLQILQYLDSKHYLKGITRFRSMRHFYHRLFGWGYTSEVLRTQLLQDYSELATLPILFYRLDYFLHRFIRYLRKVLGL